jgi:acyl carrier protein
MQDVYETVREVVSEQLGMLPKEIELASSFSADLGADSLDLVELIMALEEKFNIEIPDENADQIDTVRQAVDYISSALSEFGTV